MIEPGTLCIIRSLPSVRPEFRERFCVVARQGCPHGGICCGIARSPHSVTFPGSTDQYCSEERHLRPIVPPPIKEKIPEKVTDQIDDLFDTCDWPPR